MLGKKFNERGFYSLLVIHEDFMPKDSDCFGCWTNFNKPMRRELLRYFGVNGIYKPSNGRWNFKDAFRVILQDVATCKLPTWELEELPAIITHWLHDITKDPIVLGPTFRARWTELLTENQVSNELKIAFPHVPYPPKGDSFKFIDLFAGIGGFRVGLQSQGGKCVFSSEWDVKAKETYLLNFAEVPFGDIKAFTSENNTDDFIDRNIPDHDVLAAGFPCQPFSLAGVSARNSLGKKHGFYCKAQGTLFFDIIRIASIKRPKIIILENVKNLTVHDGGKTFGTIKEILEGGLKYSFSPRIIDSSTLVPQRRKRIYMVCTRNKDIVFSFPAFSGKPKHLGKILEKRPDKKYTLSKKMWRGHQLRTKRNIRRGTGFTAFLADLRKPANTLVARYYKDGKECLIPTKSGIPRMLTVLEALRLQGYDANRFLPNPSRSATYKQLGNSVTVPVIEKLALKIKRLLPHIS